MEALLSQLQTLAVAEAVPFLLKLCGALALWFIGRTVIGGFQRVLNLTMQRRKVDATLIRYIESLFTSALTILLLLSLLGLIGIETTSFAALLAAAGIAIGSAWAGLLSNFAAGVFLLVLRPFRVGEEINAGGVTGLVQEIGLFVTAIDTPDNLRIVVGNSKLLGDNITNYTHHTQRQISLKIPLVHGIDLPAFKGLLEAEVATIPEVLPQPPLSIEIAEFTVQGPVLAVQVWCAPRNAGAVMNGMTRAAQTSLTTVGYIPPVQTGWNVAKAG
ncbi:mechanosensitive ion channel family protein [Stigmatella sp. ncwal1]|uniref:Mechanosensitive ion channel family protein n=1 Tax=Stigmatella ashevillensis TaxID=2995309 RepID=A0ABT5DRA8_9BACT|nr:mechanosensitive ion channel family protein [Stigmatella ashevillena]MDC0714932.1 mechanosensitive ion channel family protein [Stigmatella ashevillena]